MDLRQTRLEGLMGKFNRHRRKFAHAIPLLGRRRYLSDPPLSRRESSSAGGVKMRNYHFEVQS